MKTQFWEIFTAINFSEENNLISSQTVNDLGKVFFRGKQGCLDRGKNSAPPQELRI